MTELNLHQLTGAYALDALDDSEQSLFLDHLDECESCQAEADGLARTVGRLADLVAETPPAGLRARVLEAADRTRQDAPVVTQLDAARRRRHRITAGLGGLLVAAAITFGIVITTDQSPSHSEIVASVIEAPDSQTVNNAVTGGGAATVIFSASEKASVVTLNNLPALPDTKTYELWLFDSTGTPHPAGVFVPPAEGSVTRLVADAESSTGVALTVEPAGGSDAPTTEPILVVKWT